MFLDKINILYQEVGVNLEKLSIDFKIKIRYNKQKKRKR